MRKLFPKQCYVISVMLSKNKKTESEIPERKNMIHHVSFSLAPPYIFFFSPVKLVFMATPIISHKALLKGEKYRGLD